MPESGLPMPEPAHHSHHNQRQEIDLEWADTAIESYHAQIYFDEDSNHPMKKPGPGEPRVEQIWVNTQPSDKLET